MAEIVAASTSVSYKHNEDSGVAVRVILSRSQSVGISATLRIVDNYEKGVETEFSEKNFPYRVTFTGVVNGESVSLEQIIYNDGKSVPNLNVGSLRRNESMSGTIKIYKTANPPSTPPSITVPTTIKGGERISVRWESSLGAKHYQLERSINGGTWEWCGTTDGLGYQTDVLKTWNTVAYRVRASNDDGYSGYRTSPTRTVINNTAPTISGQDSNLGDKNLGFVISYKVNDVDTSDSLVVTEKLNNSILQTINGAPRNQDLEIEITNEMLFALELNSTNTIEIKVDDKNGGIAYRRYTFRRTNTAPIISDSDKDLGQKLEPFTVDFSVSDNEGNVITIKTYLNNVLKEEYQAIDGATNTFTVSNEDWYRLKIGQHSIKIEATDEHGATAVRNYTFTRYDDKIQFTFKAPIETDIAATKILVTPTWAISAGATVKVEACNNAFDEVPTWEAITSQVLSSKHYLFINDTKTADKWGINIRFTIEKGTSTEECVIYGFGGAFE